MTIPKCNVQHYVELQALRDITISINKCYVTLDWLSSESTLLVTHNSLVLNTWNETDETHSLCESDKIPLSGDV